jgi:GT2 family glycosyltransferase
MAVASRAERTPSVGVVIVNFNGSSFLGDCVRSVRATGWPALEIVVVDNGSSDGSLATLPHAPDITVLNNGVNRGFGAAANTGIRHCLRRDHDYVLLLNNDTTVTPSLIAELASTATDRPMTVSVAQSYRWDGSGVINTHAGRFNWFAGRLREAVAGKTATQVPPTSHEVTMAGMACVLIPVVAFREVGLLDERFFMYYEDFDLAVRLRAAGYRFVLNPKAVLRHYDGGTSGIREHSTLATYYINRNRVWFMQKHCPDVPTYVTFLITFYATRAALVVRHLAGRRVDLARTIMRSVPDGLWGRRQIG